MAYENFIDALQFFVSNNRNQCCIRSGVTL